MENRVQTEIFKSGNLLDQNGDPNNVGWARSPLWDCNLENAAFYPKWLQFLKFARIKRWDYYGIFTPQVYFSATIANLGYAGNIFVYLLNFKTGEFYEEGFVVPLARGVKLTRSILG
jgi:hypothetical protein